MDVDSTGAPPEHVGDNYLVQRAARMALDPGLPLSPNASVQAEVDAGNTSAGGALPEELQEMFSKYEDHCKKGSQGSTGGSSSGAVQSPLFLSAPSAASSTGSPVEARSSVVSVPQTKAQDTAKAFKGLSAPRMYTPDAMDDARRDRAWDAAHTATSEKVDLENMLPIDDPIDEQFPVLSNRSDNRRVARSRALRNLSDCQKLLPFGSKTCPTSKDINLFNPGYASDSSWSVVSQDADMTAPVWAGQFGPGSTFQHPSTLTDSQTARAQRGEPPSSGDEEASARPSFGSMSEDSTRMETDWLKLKQARLKKQKTFTAPPAGIAKSDASATALDKLAQACQKPQGVVRRHTIFSNPQPDQTLPQTEDTMSRLSYYPAPVGARSAPARDQPAMVQKGDLTAPIQFVSAAVDAVNETDIMSARTDAVYKEVLAGPLQYMNSTHFRKATTEEKRAHDIPDSVQGDWWMLLDPQMDIPINNRCMKALQSMLVSEVVLLLSTVLQQCQHVFEARSSDPSPLVTVEEEQETKDQPPQPAPFTVEDVRVFISEYTVQKELAQHAERTACEKRGVQEPKRTNPALNPTDHFKGWHHDGGGKRTGLGAQAPREFGFMEAGTATVKSCVKCLMLNNDSFYFCKSCKGPLGPAFTTASLPEYKTASGRIMRLEPTPQGLQWVLKNHDKVVHLGGLDVTHNFKATYAQNVSDFAQVAPAPANQAHYTYADWCPNDLMVRPFSEMEAHVGIHETSPYENLEPPSGPTQMFHPDLTVAEAKPTVAAMLDRFQAMEAWKQEEVAGGYLDISALREGALGAELNPQDGEEARSSDEPVVTDDDDFLNWPYVKRLLRKLQGSELADILMRHSDAQAGVDRDQLIVQVQGMALQSEAHKESKQFQKVFYRKVDNKNPNKEVVDLFWNTHHQLLYETKFCALGQWMKGLNKSDITESVNRFKALKIRLQEMQTGGLPCTSYMGELFWSELPDLVSKTSGEAEAMDDTWKVLLLQDIIKRHWSETKSTAGVWQVVEGTPPLPKPCFTEVKKADGQKEVVCKWDNMTPPTHYLKKEQIGDYQALEPYTWPCNDVPYMTRAFSESQCRYKFWEMKEHSERGDRPWEIDATSLHTALLRVHPWEAGQSKFTYDKSFYFLRHCHQFDIIELFVLHGGRYTLRFIYDFYTALPISRRNGERDNEAQRGLLASRFNPDEEGNVLSIFEAAGVTAPSEGLPRRCALQMMGRFIAAEAFVPPSLEEVKTIPVALERDDDKQQWMRAICDPDLFIDYNKLFRHAPDLATQAGNAIGGCLIVRFHYRCTKYRSWVAPVVDPKVLVKILMTLNSEKNPGWGPHDPPVLQCAFWIIKEFPVVQYMPDGNQNRDWSFGTFMKDQANVERAKRCAEFFLEEMNQEKAQGKLEAPVQRTTIVNKEDGTSVLLPPSSHLNCTANCAKTWAKAQGKTLPECASEAGGVVLAQVNDYPYFWFRLFCGMVLPNVSGWEFFLKEPGVHSRNKFVCRHCVEEWGGSDKGSYMLTIYGLRGKVVFQQLVEAGVTEARSSSSSSANQGQTQPMKFQGLQCIVNYPPQSLWDRFINNKMAYQERLAPKEALKDTPVDPNLKPEDRIDCTGEALSDLLWSLCLAPEETDASRNLRSLATEAIRRMREGK